MSCMRSEKDSATLHEMLHHIDLAERFRQGRGFENLRDDLMPLYAVTRCLEIISEASRRLSDELKARHHHIPWREMAAAGNFYRIIMRTCCRHAYGKLCRKIYRRCARSLRQNSRAATQAGVHVHECNGAAPLIARQNHVLQNRM